MTQAQLTIVFGALFGMSELLSLIPSVKANGIFQAIFNIISTLAGKNE